MTPASDLPTGAAATAYVAAEVPAAVRPALAARVAAASVEIEVRFFKQKVPLLLLCEDC